MKRLIAALMLLAAPAAAETLYENSYGLWAAGANRGEGAPTCYMSHYDERDDALVMILAGRDGGAYLAISFFGWPARSTDTVAVLSEFSNGSRWLDTFSRRESDQPGMHLIIEMDGDFLVDMAAAGTMRVRVGGGPNVTFNLRGSMAAARAFLECVTAVRA